MVERYLPGGGLELPSRLRAAVDEHEPHPAVAALLGESAATIEALICTISNMRRREATASEKIDGDYGSNAQLVGLANRVDARRNG